MLLHLLFPPKCTLCKSLLKKNETDFCHHCRTHTPEVLRTKRNIPFIAQWTAVWYYKDDVRKSIHRFKFGNARSYADAYARPLAVKLQEEGISDRFDLMTWVPTSPLRRFTRGYDQAELLTKALSKELGRSPLPLLKRIRHTPPQSRLRDASARRANIQGAYRAIASQKLSGMRVLLLDDVVTTGATASECARVLLTAGVKEVTFAAVAAANHDKTNERR